MRKSIIVLIISLAALLLTGAILGGYCYYWEVVKKSPEQEVSQTITGKDAQSQEGKLEIEKAKTFKLDPAKEATHLSKVANAGGVYWMRQFELTWNDIEPTKGELDWSRTDEHVKYLSEMEVYPLVNVRPFANWDQDVCHPEEKYRTEFDVEKVGKPCDMTAYVDFLAKAVERYNGDGRNDMPGLKIPIKYWEIMNEPAMQGGTAGGMGEDLKFFVGTSQEYLDILKSSYQVIKHADPEAKVLHAGMAGMDQDFQNFWQPIFAGGGGDYFDIANIHTISTDEQREDLFVIKFKRFLEQYDIKDKPIWITEVQFGDLMGRPRDITGFEKLMTKGTVFSLAQGADKLFYIENWLHWDEEYEELKSEKELGDSAAEEKEEKDKEPEKKPTLDTEALSSSTHKTYLNLVDKVNDFDRIETIKEEYEENDNEHSGATSTIGQYKFIDGEEVVYVLWGKADLPAEITGKVLVTDIYGEGEEREAGDVILDDTPIFVEVR